MAVKKKDRKVSENSYLNDARALVKQIAILTRGPEVLEDGRTSKPGLLGNSRDFQAFGCNLLNSSKRAHGCAYQASKTHLKDLKTLETRAEFYYKSIAYCDSMLRELDLCKFMHQNSKKKTNSLNYVVKLVYTLKQSLQDRINRDKLIYEQQYMNK